MHSEDAVAWYSILMRHLWTLRAFYLLTGLSGGFFGPYLSLLLERDGFSSSAIGGAMSLAMVIAIVVQPLFGLLVDRFHATRTTLALTFLVPAIFAFLYDQQNFLLIVSVYALSTLFSAPQAPIADAYAVGLARAYGTTYGTIRSFGSMGYALGGYAGGLYLEHLSIHLLWLPYALLCVIGGAIAFFLPREKPSSVVRGSIRQGMSTLLKNPRFVLFLLGGFLISETLTAFNTYFVLAFHEIGGSFADTGIALFIASLTNVPAMLIAARVIRRVGREKTMLIAATAYVVRWGVQVLIPIPSVAIAIQVLHGISFGFFYVAAVGFVAQTTTRELQATGQSIFGMVCNGLAGIGGNLVNGFLLRAGGPTLMYAVCAIAALFGAVCFLLVMRVKDAAVDTTKALLDLSP